MRRAILVAAGTVAGTAAVLAYQPGTLFGGQPADTAAAATTQTSVAYDGDAAQTEWGPVQVSIVVEGDTITSVTGYQQTSDHKSEEISGYALPELQQQALAAQSADIDGVSGASYTSQGFTTSLTSALQKAGLS